MEIEIMRSQFSQKPTYNILPWVPFKLTWSKSKAVSPDRSPVTRLFATAAAWGVVGWGAIKTKVKQQRKGHLSWYGWSRQKWWDWHSQLIILGESWLLGRGLRSTLSHVAHLLSEDHAVPGFRNWAAATVQIFLFLGIEPQLFKSVMFRNHHFHS